jgi:hypothetical protein
LQRALILIIILIAAGCGAPTSTRTYADSVAGIALDYPAGWFVTGPTTDPSSRVTYITSYDMSKAAGQGGIQEGTAKLDIIAMRQPGQSLESALSAVKGGDAKILREERLQLAGNIPAARLTITDVFGDTAHILVTVVGDWTIQVGGYGKIPDFDKVFDGIVRTLRRA